MKTAELKEKPVKIRIPKRGETVIYHDAFGKPHVALVNEVWSLASHAQEEEELPTVNLVYISTDKTKQDAWGRQIERDSSVVHKSNTSAHGNYWRFEDEEPNPIREPMPDTD